MLNIAVIIPSNHSPIDLFKIVEAVCNQSVRPTEIIIINSFFGSLICPVKISELCLLHKVKLKYEHRKLAFPGHARNIGLELSNADLIAFIDVQTIPRPNWLKSSLEVLSKNNVAGVFGRTSFDARTWAEMLIRDAFFGVSPRKTLPGSIFKREVFYKTGHFIEWARAGEDTEWMSRLELMKIPMTCMPISLVDYEGLIGVSLNSILRKWHRNYSASHELPHLFPQKMFLWIFLYPLIIFVAFNWNYLFANWYEDSPFYIAHITKIAAILPPLAYVITRGVVLPFRRGVKLWSIFPLRFIVISLICLMADAIKALVFSRLK